MNFKFLSSDFAAVYNDIMDEYIERQKSIDGEYSKRIAELVEAEKARLSATVSPSYKAGDKVRSTSNGLEATIVESKIDFTVDRQDFEDGIFYGPNRFLPLKSRRDEIVATCDDDVYRYVVETDSDPISKDYGIDKKLTEVWADEIEPVD